MNLQIRSGLIFLFESHSFAFVFGINRAYIEKKGLPQTSMFGVVAVGGVIGAVSSIKCKVLCRLYDVL